MNNPVKTLAADKMTVEVYDTRDHMGQAAAFYVAEKIKEIAGKKDEVNIIFPCAVSQSDFFHYLFSMEDIPWQQVNGFVMDEYLGLPKGHPSQLSIFANREIFGKVPFRNGFIMDATNPDFEQERLRYSALLQKHPLDISCLGIGENGHLAYNDPHVADFNDPELVKLVEIDETSRQQAIHDGTFSTLEEVPSVALTVTIPVMIAAPVLSTVVPGPHKTESIYRTVHEEISTACPATILRNYDGLLFTDLEGAAKL